MTAISGGKFWSGFAAGALSSIASSAWGGGTTKTEGFSAENNWAYGAKTIHHAGLGAGTGTAGMIAFGTVADGAGAALTGGNFWQGAVTGLVVSGLNHAAHMGDDNGYDEQGNKVNDNGGDDTDYLYRNGKIVGSKKVFSFTDDSSEYSSDYRAYGVKIHTEGTGFDWTWDSVKDAAISVGALRIPSSKMFNTKITIPVFKELGKIIRNYVPKLGANRYLRIGTSHTRGREVFRVIWGNNSKHLLDIDLGKIPKIK